MSLAAAVLGLAVGGVTGWGGAIGGAAGVGLLTGSLAHERQQSSCAATWASGAVRSVLVRLHDRVGSRGLATATVLAAPEECGGDLLLRARPGTLPAGGRAVLVGSFRAPTVLHVEHARVLRGPRQVRYLLREVLGRRIERLYGARAPFVEALVLGRRDDLDPSWRRVFADAGIAHLLAISGLHVGIVAAWTLLLARRLLRPMLAALVTAVVVWGYVGLLGFPAPAARSAAFVSLHAWAMVRQRHPPPDAVLAAAVLVVLALDPEAGSEVGAWLSVAATWGTGFALRQLPARAGRQPVLSLLAASLGATLATAPITAFAFGTVAPIGLLTNLAAVPLAGLAVPGIFASLALGGPVAAGTGLSLAAIERCAMLAAAVPGGQIRGTPGMLFAIPWMVALLAALWVCRPRPDVRLLRLRAAAVLAAASWTAVIVPAIAGRVGARGLSIYVLDVGQGDAIALRTPRGRWVTVDGGPRSPAGDAGRRVVLPFLRSHGARTLDVAVASHGDADHLGGIPALVQSLTPELVIDPGQPVGTPLYLDYLRTVDQTAVTWRPGRAGDTLVVDSVTLAVLHPTQAWVDSHLATNENSVVIRVSFGGFDAVLAGDAGFPAESVLSVRAVASEVLKVGHHGSAGASSDAWLDAVSPDVAVISVGENAYGHPSPETLGRLAARGIAVFRTDRGGTVTIHTDGRYFEVAQGAAGSWLEEIRCLILRLSPSSGSSLSRSACTRPQRVSFPTSSTTSHSPPRSSPAMSGGRAW